MQVLAPSSEPAFDAYSFATLSAYVAKVKPTDATARSQLQAALSTVSALWNPIGAFTPAGLSAAFDAYLLQLWTGTGWHRSKVRESVRKIELDLAVIVDRANAWTAALA